VVVEPFNFNADDQDEPVNSMNPSVSTESLVEVQKRIQRKKAVNRMTTKYQKTIWKKAKHQILSLKRRRVATT
jgi:hypothetical protein